jgi:hypothetical protein
MLIKRVRDRASRMRTFSRSTTFSVLFAILLCTQTTSGAAAADASQASAPNSAATNMPGLPGNIVAAGGASIIVIHGKIVSVDRQKKLVTLEGPNSKQVSLHVYDPYNLAAAKPGETLVARFYEIATLHQLAPGQSPPAPSLAQGIVSAVPGQTPGAAFGSQLQFAVTVDAIDKNDKAISLKGPDGVVEVVDVANPETLDQVKIGEHIVVTLTDAVVIKLDKAGSRGTNAEPAIDAPVRAVLARPCSVLSAAKTVTYPAEINFDSVLPSYVKLQYAAEMDTAIARPDKLAITYKSDLGAKAIWYNGKTLTILDPPHRSYASIPAPDSIDAMLVKTAQEKNVSIPLEAFDFEHPCERVYPKIQRGKYVGVNDVDGVDCDHLAFVQSELDWQVWIDRSSVPLPRKIVITYKQLPAQPQWAAVFSNWRFNRKLPAALFQPKIPSGMIQTSFIGTQEKSK